jgi:hypothetical protein
MQKVIVSAATFAFFATRALAGVAWPSEEPISFVDCDWEDKCLGETFPIKWSKGNGKSVSVTIKSSDWEDELCGKFMSWSRSKSPDD